MKKYFALLVMTLVAYHSYAQWTGHSSSSDLTSPISRLGDVGTTGLFYSDRYNGTQIRLNSEGAHWGKIGNPSMQVWSLGWGGLDTGINSVLTWTTSGNVGIGTTNPSSRLHLFNPSSSTYLNIDKANSGYEGGIIFSNNGAAFFYLWNDNDGDALKIEASGLTGETDATPRMEFPRSNKNIYMAESGGNVGIGTTTADYKLTVNGPIKAEEVKVVVDVPSDFVFDNNYTLRSLSEVEKYVSENKHLPGIPSAQEIKENGWEVGEMSNRMLEKIEELTLYMIDLKKENEKLKEEVDQLKRFIKP